MVMDLNDVYLTSGGLCSTRAQLDSGIEYINDIVYYINLLKNWVRRIYYLK